MSDIDYETDDEDYGTEFEEQSPAPVHVPESGGNPFDLPTQAAQAGGSALDATTEQEASIGKTFPMLVNLTNNGLADKVRTAVDGGFKRKPRTFMKEGGMDAAKGFVFRTGDGGSWGEELGEFPFWLVWLRKPELAMMSKALETVVPGIKPFKSPVKMYTESTGVQGVAVPGKKNLPPATWDAVVRMLHNRDPRLKEVWKDASHAWDKREVNGKIVSQELPVFFKEDGNPASTKRYAVELQDLQTVPATKIPPLPQGTPCRVLDMTNFMSKWWQHYRNGAATVYAIKNGFDVNEVVRGTKLLKFENWFSTLETRMALTPYTNSYDSTNFHPKFFCPLKETMGMGLWEAMGTKEFTLAANSTGGKHAMTDLNREKTWFEMAGDVAIVRHKETGEYSIKKVPDLSKDPRKNQ